MSYRQVGRHILFEKEKRKDVKLSLLSKVLIWYYNLRISLIERRIKKYAPFARGYGYELFISAVYHKQSYLHKIEARKSKDEVRSWEKGRRDMNDNK